MSTLCHVKGRPFLGQNYVSITQLCHRKDGLSSYILPAHFSRRVEASFTAGQVSSDGGALLLRQADGKIGLLKRVASCFTDRRSPLLVQHQLGEMLSQRVYGLALGYEDLCDHEQLRHDPLMAVLSGRRKLEDPLAGKPGSPRTGLRPWGGRAR